MAQLIVSCVVDKLADLLIEESNFFPIAGNDAISEKINEVRVHLNRMQCSLKDAESKRKVNQVADQWIHNVLKVAYQTEDAIDNLVVKINTGRYQRFLSLNSVVRRIINAYLNDLPLASRELGGIVLGKSILQIQQKIRVIHENRVSFWAGSLGPIGGKAPLLVQLHVNPEVVGRFEADKQNVIYALISDYSGESLQPFSIVGPGGSGKTTLAHIVYNSEEVKKHFEHRIWLSLSREFKPSNILKKLYEGIGEEERYNGRCLIVLDDVWTDEVFAHVAEGIPNVCAGSWVLITSRFLNIANLAYSNSSQHKVGFLNKEESMDLFLKKAVPSGLAESDELFPLAEKLCDRAGGLPLALTVLGEFVSMKPPTYSSWLKVVESFDWHSDCNRCMEILSNSYEDLPDFLKACFRYLACFPKNYEIPAQYLYKLWIAEGFIAPRGMVTLEDIAKDYLENLVQRSLVQGDKYSNGAIKSCRIHNLFHELAIYEARKIDLLVIYDKENMQHNLDVARRVVIHHHLNNNNIFARNEKMKMATIRSLLNFTRDNPVWRRFMLVRVLELRGTQNLNSLPEELQNMIHLKYLGLRSTDVNSIPKNIGRLLNLQTLDIRDSKITNIPVSLWKIKTLRHVLGSKPRNPFVVPDGPPPQANLLNLQTLATFNIPKSWKECLPHLPALRKFGLSYTKMEDPNSEPDWTILTRLLGDLINLVSLVIRGEQIPSQILDVSISPSYPNIKHIYLCGNGSKLSLGIIDLPPNLTKLTLIEVELDQDPMPKLEKLQDLEVFRLIRAVVTVKILVSSAKGYPELRKVQIDRCTSLEELKRDLIFHNCSE